MLKLLNVFLILVLVMPLILNIAAIPPEEQEQEQDDIKYELTEEPYDDEATEPSSEHGFGRLLSQKKTKARRVRCNKFPRICLTKGSPGPYCCKRKCVNVLTDRHNCGACGKKCKYSHICCNGKCVNPSFNRRHCGGCNNRCQNDGVCAFGLCNYS